MNFYIVGFMGSGKTTIANILKEKIDSYKYVDLDDEIIKNEKMEINDIFKEFGEERFRELETEALIDFSILDNQIISCGGGIVIKNDNINLMKKTGKIIYLMANMEKIYSNLQNKVMERPLLKYKFTLDKIKQIFKSREGQYLKSDFIVSANGDINETVKKVYDIIVTH